MKKLLALLLALICAVSLTTPAFAAPPDAYAIYQDYVKKSKSVKSMELTVVERFSIIDGDRTYELTKQNISATVLTTKDNKLQMEMRMKDPITNKTLYGYFKDGYIYQKTDYGNFKVKMSTREAMSTTASIDLNLTREILKDAKVEKVDGGTKITYKIKPNTKSATVNSILGGVGSSKAKMTFSNMTTTIVIGKDGMLKSTANVYGVTITDGNETHKFKISQATKVKTVNSVTEINFPYDLNTYETLRF